MVAMSLITLIMGALTTFFIGSLRATNGLRQRQIAVALADQGIDKASAVAPFNLVLGRDTASVTAQWTDAGSLGIDVSDMSAVSDAAAGAGSGATALIPTAGVLQTVNNLAYSTNFVVGTCYQPVGGATASRRPPSAGTPLSTESRCQSVGPV